MNRVIVFTPKNKYVKENVLKKINTVDNTDSSNNPIICLSDYEFYREISMNEYDNLDKDSREKQLGNLFFSDGNYYILGYKWYEIEIA